MKKNLVSIVTPCYNAEKFIGQTIDSVLAQTHTHWELIIVDDCSSDSSVEIVERYTHWDKRIKLIRQPERKDDVALSRNKAIEEACGQYIAFLDADDLWLPNKLEKQLAFMREHDLSFTYSSYQLMNESGEYLGEFLTQPQISYHFLLKTNCIGCLTAIYDVEKIGKIYMQNAYKREDYATWLHILKQIQSTQGMLESTAQYRIYNHSVSANKLKMAYYQWKVYRENEHLGIFKSVYYFLNYAFYGFLKYK